jgi:hypothetical protein
MSGQKQKRGTLEEYIALQDEGDGPAVPEMDEPTQKAWPLFAKKFSQGTPQEFYTKMTKGLPPQTELGVLLNEDGSLKFLRYICNSKDDPAKTFFQFYYPFSGTSVSSAGAEVQPALQEMGISRTVNNNIIGLCFETGMQEAQISADGIGIYAWARIGFVPTRDSWNKLRERIEERLKFFEESPSPQDGPLPHEYVDAIHKVLASDDPKSYWFIVDQEYPYYGTSLGKLLTLDAFDLPNNIPWDQAALKMLEDFDDLELAASFNINDPDCAKRLAAYLTPDQQAKPSVQSKASAAMRTL